MRRRAAVAGLVMALAAIGCTRHPVQPAGPVRYIVGAGYQAGGTWFYPQESFRYDRTGLASVLPDRRGVTATNEAIDPAAMVAAHQTLQLPSVARVTNMESGAQVLVRINDRGPASPARLIALSPRAASLLGISGTARVRVEVDEAQSLALREQLNGGPRLTLAAAPRASVTAEALAPPAGIGQSARGRSGSGTPAVQAEAPVAAQTVPDRLPEVVSRGPALAGQLMIRAGSFGQMQYASRVVARLPGLGARVLRQRDGRAERYEVIAGPFDGVPSADAALDQALRAGVSDARIVVE